MITLLKTYYLLLSVAGSRFSLNFEEQIFLFKGKFIKVNYSLRFISSVINILGKGKDYGDTIFQIPSDLFEIIKLLISIERP